MCHILRIFLVLFCIIAQESFQTPLAQEAGSVEFLQLPNLNGTRGGSLVLAVAAEPDNFNRMLTSSLAGLAITNRISADLVHINRSSLKIEPSLAKKWEVDKTGRVYTIHLRRGIRFSNGESFSADDVLFTFQVLSDPNIHCPIRGQIEIDGKLPSLTKIDDFTVRLAFQRPVGMGLRMLDSIPVIPKDLLIKAYRDGRFANVWGPTVNPKEVAGLGPFRLKEYQRNVKVVLERNPYYWKKDGKGKTLPYLDTITFLIIKDTNSQALRFQQGELDMVSSPALNPENYASLRRSRGKYNLRDLGPGLAMCYLWFNLNSGAKSSVDPEKMALFEKPEFRRAVSYALDRSGMTRSILLGLGAPQYGPVSSGNKEWYYEGISRTGHDPNRSRKLLQQIGLRDSNGDGVLEYGRQRRPLEVMLFASSGDRIREKIAQVIQSDLSNVGIRIGIQYLPGNEIASRILQTFDYEATLLGITPTDVTPDLQADLWYSSGSQHFWHPGQKTPATPWEASVDSLISKLVKSMDPAVRKASFDRVQEIWAEQMPAIPTVAPSILVGWSSRLGNISPSILAPHLIWNAEELTTR